MTRSLLLFFLSFLFSDLAFAACTKENVEDTFTTTSYSNDSGNQNWSAAWQEIGESDGVSAGQARVNSSNCSSGNCLRIGTPGGVLLQYTDRGASREVDLSGASSATLSFNYFTGFGGGTADVSLEVSNDGGSNWTRLQNYIINSTSFTANPESFDLTPYIAVNTQIRFIGSGSSGSRTGMYIDDINIDYEQCAQLVTSYTFNDDWSTNSPLEDTTGSADGIVSGAVSRILSPASGSKPETCAAGQFDGGAIDISGLPISTTSGDKTSISFWMNWDGTNTVIPLGWAPLSLWFDSSSFGFYTGRNGIYGIAATGLANTWQHITVVITNNDVQSNKIFINGVEQSSSQIRGTPFNQFMDVEPNLRIGGWRINNSRRFSGQLDEIKIYTGEISQATVDANRTATSLCSQPIEYRFDETKWAGVANEVIDSSNKNYHGTAFDTQPAEGLICNAADFSADSTDDYISLNNVALNNAENFTISVWAKTPNTRTQTIVSGSSGSQHNELIMFFPNSTEFQPYLKNSGASSIPITNIADDKWHHLAWTRNGTENCIYVDGVKSTCQTASGSPVSIANGGLIIGQKQGSLGGRFDINQDFEGLLDELTIFDYVLSESEVKNIRSNNLAGDGWDGQPRTCPPQNNLDHFEISYAKAGLTCLPSSVTIKACADAACTTLITDDVDITFSPATGWASNPITISNGQATLDLNHPTVGTLPLNITASSITPVNALTCLADSNVDLSCSITVAETGFVFDVPTLTACKTSTNVTIKAVKQGSNTAQCVSALTGNKTLSFWSDYDLPTSGSNQVKINGTDIATSSAGTNINLTFDINGEAQFTTQYNDAGRLNLTANYDDGNGLVMTGSDLFISKPVMLVSYSSDGSAACASQYASCSRFKKAGETFDLKVNAACWTDDADTNFTDNPTTPNFELAGIGLNHSVIAPAGGVTGQLAQSSFNFATADGGSKTITQTVSEVGVFEFDLTAPPYFINETISTTTSEPIGRFYPDHFETTTASNGSFNSACAGFSYSGQAFTYLSNPQLLVTAFSASSPATVTQNYQGDFAKLADTDFTVTAPPTDANQLGADNANLVRLDWQAVVPSLTDNNNGSLTFAFGNDNYTYRHELNSQIAPFNNAIDLTFTTITDSDNVSTSSLPHTLQPSGESIRFGRIALNSGHGSELMPLAIAISAEYYTGFSWVENSADQCTSLNLNTHVRLANAETAGGSAQVGTTAMTIAAGTTSATLSNTSPFSAGSGLITLSAPGEDNLGFVDIFSNIGTTYHWLLDLNNGEAQGRASFGLYKGSDNIIFRRERY
jgi:MSHA biogenesis protein MshQ